MSGGGSVRSPGTRVRIRAVGWISAELHGVAGTVRATDHVHSEGWFWVEFDEPAPITPQIKMGGCWVDEDDVERIEEAA